MEHVDGSLPTQDCRTSSVTKRFLVSDVAKTFDVLGWYSPCTIKMKILFQQLWEMKEDWDDEVPESVRDSWLKWRSELDLLSTKYVPRCYHDEGTSVTSMELHGFSDASFTSEWSALMAVRRLDLSHRRPRSHLSKDSLSLV